MSATQRIFRILIADDVRLSLEMDRTFFQRSGFEVLTATDGLLALDLSCSSLPDLVILDEMMPGLRGTEVCSRMRQRPETAEIPVIVTSAFDNDALRGACTQAAVNAFVPKTAGKEALLKAAAQILGVPQRKMIRIPVFFIVEGMLGAKESLGKAVDLSESGMCIESNRRYEVGANLILRFVLPGERREIHVNAEVCRSTQRGDGSYVLGLEFSRVPIDCQKLVNLYIDRSLSVRV